MLLAFGLNAQQSSTYCNNRFGFCVNYPASLKQAANSNEPAPEPADIPADTPAEEAAAPEATEGQEG